MIADETTPTVEMLGSISEPLDRLLGGGWPKGRIVEVFGGESEQKKLAVTERGLHAVRYAGEMTASFYVRQPSLDGAVLNDVRNPAVGAVLIRGLDRAVELAEHPDLAARMLRHGLREVAAAAHDHNTLVIIVHNGRTETRVNLDDPPASMGAVKFYASIRLECTARPNGSTHVACLKNKLDSPGFRQAALKIDPANGTVESAV